MIVRIDYMVLKRCYIKKVVVYQDVTSDRAEKATCLVTKSCEHHSVLRNTMENKDSIK